MEDVKRVWGLLITALHAIFVFINYFAHSSPVILGFVLIALAVFVLLYQRRRRFYGGLDVAGDWAPTYGGIVSGRATEWFLSLTVKVIAFFGLMVLFQHYLPVLFEDIIGFIIRTTG